jgi:hypothetical protein
MLGPSATWIGMPSVSSESRERLAIQAKPAEAASTWSSWAPAGKVRRHRQLAGAGRGELT